VEVGRAMELLSETDGASGYPTCPLTPQVVQFLLRQTMIGVFANHMAQDLYLSASSSSLYTMIPFCVGPNGVSLAGAKMLLPTFLAENIECCQRKIKTLTNRTGQESVFDIVTVLARPGQQAQLGNFTAQVNQGGGIYAPQSVYTPPTILEMPANLIDCSWSSGGGVEYFSPTGALIEKQFGIWNDWITGLSGNLSPLVPFSPQGGISALLTSLFTRSQVNNSDAIRAKRRQMEKEPLPVKPKELTREQKYIQSFDKMCSKVMVTPDTQSYINMNTEKETICNQPPSNPVWKYISMMILPVFLTQAEQDEASLQAWQTFQVQPYMIPADTIAGGEGNLFNTVFPSISSRLEKMAAIDTKANNQQQNNELINELVVMGEQGRGGFFADVAGFLADTFVPGSGAIAKNVVSSWGG